AHIQGVADMEIELSPEGKIVAWRASSGSPILVQAAADSLRLSQLECRNCNAQSVTVQVAYRFELASDTKGQCALSGEHRDPAVLDAPNHVTVTAIPLCITVENIDPVEKVRSIRCLYLWKCARR